jgi:cation diffusion facilitator family transporter
MASCCEDKSCEITALREKHKKVLIIVLIINALMFFIEGAYGWVSHSTALLADALDMFGDALVYGMSLYVLTKSVQQQAKVSLSKGLFMFAFGLFVLFEAGYKVINPVMPNVEIMGVIGFIALLANAVCFLLLYAHRADNLNMSSTWLCSRNDLIANVGVLIAALLSYLLVSRWPDIVIGVFIAGIFLKSAVAVIRQSVVELKV